MVPSTDWYWTKYTMVSDSDQRMKYRSLYSGFIATRICYSDQYFDTVDFTFGTSDKYGHSHFLDEWNVAILLGNHRLGSCSILDSTERMSYVNKSFGSESQIYAPTTGGFLALIMTSVPVVDNKILPAKEKDISLKTLKAVLMRPWFSETQLTYLEFSPVPVDMFKSWKR